MYGNFTFWSKYSRAMPRARRTSYIAASLVTLHGPVLWSAPRELKSTDGKTITAEIVAVRASDVVLSINNREVPVPVARFSRPDQDFFAEWKEKSHREHVPKLRVEVATGKSDKSDRADDFDDRTGSFQFSVKVTNEEIHFDLQGAKAELAVIGEDAGTRGKYGILQKASFEVSAKPGKIFEWKGARLQYSFDDRPPAYSGSSYAGYILQIRNAADKVIYRNAIPQNLEKHAEAILKMETGAAFDREAQSRGTISILED